MTFHVDISFDDADVRSKIAILRDKLGAGTVLRLLATALQGMVSNRFRTRGDGTWKPLAPTTIDLRRGRGGDAPLQVTGMYRQSWVAQTDEAAGVVQVGSAAFQAEWMELGTRPYVIPRTDKVKAALGRGGWIVFGRGAIHHPGVPARPVLPNKAVIEKLIEAQVDQFLADTAAKVAA